MRLFNGIKGISILYFIFGSTYMFAWYAIIGNYYDLDEMRKTYTFSVVTGAYYMAPIGFFTGGFLQTFSFEQKDESQKFSASNILHFYKKRLLRFASINVIMLLAGLYIFQYVGSGPIWENYDTTVK